MRYRFDDDPDFNPYETGTSNDPYAQPLADVQAQLARVDTKASILAGFALAGLTGGAALASKAHLHGLSVASAAMAAVLTAAALVLLGRAIQPNLRGDFGFMRWAHLPNALKLEAEIEQQRSPAWQRAQQLWLLSRSTERKYRRVAQAVDLLGLGLAFALATATLTGLGW